MDVDKKFPNLLTDADIKRINSDIKELEMQMNPQGEAEKVGYMAHAQRQIQNKNDLAKAIFRKKAELHHRSPKKLKGREANEAYRWCKDYEKYANENMPTVKQDGLMHEKGVGTPHGETTFEQAIQQNIAWMKPENQQRAQIYRHLKMRLDPGHNGRMDHLRRKG